jgi:hypothetical protein
MPRLQREIIAAAVGGDPSLELTTVSEDADVIVVGTSDPELLDGCRAQLTTRPRAKLFALTPDGLQTTLYELRGVIDSLGPLDPSELAAAIRAALERGLRWERA